MDYKMLNSMKIEKLKNVLQLRGLKNYCQKILGARAFCAIEYMFP